MIRCDVSWGLQFRASAVRAIAPVLLSALLATLPISGVLGAETVYIDSNQTRRGDGSSLYPHRSWSDVRLKSGTRYLFRRGGRYEGSIEVGGVSKVEIGAWGEGPDPIIDGRNSAEYGIRLYSTSDVTITGLELANFRGACVLVLGSVDYQIRANHCHDAVYGVAVNAGKLGPRGTIEGNLIHGVGGDGIGAWSLPEGAIIRANRIFDFGNDGIDVLGSWGAVIEDNVIHDSTDRPEFPRGLVHAGIKAGGKRGAGGGNTTVRGNTVYRVKNFGIWNRGAVGNIYRDNICYENGVNFNFVSSEGPAMAVIEGNLAREPTFAAGLRYSVLMPAARDLRRAAGNQWQGGLVRVAGVGLITEETEYRKAMWPHEQDARF
jgi:hypothetical protein